MKCSFIGILLRHLLLALVALSAMGAELPSPSPELSGAPEGGVMEILSLRTKADRGDTAAQVVLGETFSTRQQFGEAAYWYRRAATNGDVTAQLGLAGFLVAGRGVSIDRREAAYWMRLAADGIERGTPAVPARSGSIIMVRSNAAPAAIKTSSITPPQSDSSKNLFTNSLSHSTRVVKEDNLAVVEPRFQESNGKAQPAAVPK